MTEAGWTHTGYQETPKAFRVPFGPGRRKLLVEARPLLVWSLLAPPGKMALRVCPSPMNAPSHAPPPTDISHTPSLGRRAAVNKSV